MKRRIITATLALLAAYTVLPAQNSNITVRGGIISEEDGHRECPFGRDNSLCGILRNGEGRHDVHRDGRRDGEPESEDETRVVPSGARSGDSDPEQGREQHRIQYLQTGDGPYADQFHK